MAPKKKPPPKKPPRKPPAKKAPRKLPVEQRARLDVRMAQFPILQELARQRAAAIRDQGHRENQLGSLYGNLQTQLGKLGGPLQHGLQDISGDLQGQLAGLGSQLGSSGPSGELAAAGGLLGNIGAGALSQLASDRSRSLAYDASVGRQGAVEGTVAQRNSLSDLWDSLDTIRQQKTQTIGQFGPAFQQQLADLRDQVFQQNLASKEFGLRKRSLDLQEDQNQGLLEFLQSQLGGFGGGGGGFGGGGGNFPGPGNGNGGVAGGPGHPGPQGHPNPGSGGDNPGGGGGGTSPFEAFTSGHMGWGQIKAPNRGNILDKINDYWIGHRDEPAFASLTKSAPPGSHDPIDLVNLIRQFYYGPHRPGQPGGRPLP